MTNTDSGAKQLLKRELGFFDLTLFYIAGGLSLRWIATAAAAGPSTIVVWIFACLFFFIPLAASVLELSARYPQEGGLYVWTQRAFGDFSGFLAASRTSLGCSTSAQAVCCSHSRTARS